MRRNGCPFCRESFPNKELLRAHVRDKHGWFSPNAPSGIKKARSSRMVEIGVPSMPCEACGESFALRPDDLIAFDGAHHKNCPTVTAHFHLATPFPICSKCRGGG